jgi:hypothetical protein
MWKNRREREIRETAIFNFVDAMKYDRRMYDELSDMIQFPIVWKVKRRIKTVQHYLIHNDKYTAKEQLYQFMDEIENVIHTNSCQI